MNNLLFQKVLILCLFIFTFSSISYASSCDEDDFHSYILLDNSRSMGTSRLNDAKESVKNYLATLGSMTETCVNLYIANVNKHYIGKYDENNITFKLNQRSHLSDNPLVSLDKFTRELIPYKCDQLIILTDGDDNAGDKAIYNLQRISNFCDQIGIVGVYLPHDSDLNRISNQSNSTYCNGTDAYNISNCLLKNLTPFTFNKKTKRCEDSKGNQGYNKAKFNRDLDNFECYDFRNIDLAKNKWKKLFNLNKTGELISFKGSLFDSLQFNYKQLRGNFSNSSFKNTIFTKSIIVSKSLSNTSFSNAQLISSTIKIPKSSSRKMSFCNSNLDNLKIKSSKFINITFCNLDFSYLDLEDSSFFYVNWNNATFRNTSFIRSRFVDSSFNSSAIESSSFQGALEIDFLDTAINNSSIIGNGAISITGKGIVDSNSEGHINYRFKNTQLTDLDFSKTYGKLTVNSSIVNKIIFNKSYNHLDLNLSNSTCNFCDFDDSNLNSFSVKNSIIKNSSFITSTIKNLHIENSSLTSVEFKDSRLPNAKLINIKLKSSTIKNTLDGTQSFNGLNAKSVLFEKSIFKVMNGKISFDDVKFNNSGFQKKIILDNLSLKNSVFNNTSIKSLQLSKAYLSNIIFNDNVANISCSHCKIINIKFNANHSLVLDQTKISETQVNTNHCIHIFKNSDINYSSLKCNKYDVKFERANIKNTTISSKQLVLSLNGSTANNILVDKSFIDLKIHSSNIIDSSFQSNRIQDYSNITNSNIKNVNFSENNFSNLTISRSTFENADFINTRFSNLTKMEFTTFKKSRNMNNGKNVFKVSFTDVKVSNNLFNGSNFGLSTFSDCNFSHINMTNITFGSSEIFNTYFDNSTLTNVSFLATNIEESSFANSKIHKSRFNTLTITDSILTNLKIKNSNFVQYTKIVNSDLNNSEFESNFIGGLSLVNSTAKDLYLIDNNLINASFINTNLQGSYAIGTQIGRATFEGISRQDDIISD